MATAFVAQPFPICRTPLCHLPSSPHPPQASRKADSILNHTLKNTMADAVGDIDMFLQKTAANIDVMHLRQAAAALRRGMRQCRHRQAYLQLAAHRYQVVLRPLLRGRLLSGEGGGIVEVDVQ